MGHVKGGPYYIPCTTKGPILQNPLTEVKGHNKGPYNLWIYSRASGRESFGHSLAEPVRAAYLRNGSSASSQCL